MNEKAQAIHQAFYEAASRVPLTANDELTAAATPGGGDWRCEVNDGAICRSIFWGHTEVALVNPRGDLDDTTEGQIAMAMRALPMLDAAMRSIIAVEFIERPAPRVPEPDEEDGSSPTEFMDPPAGTKDLGKWWE